MYKSLMQEEAVEKILKQVFAPERH